MKAKFLKTTSINGNPVYKGEVRELDDGQAELFTLQKQAVPYDANEHGEIPTREECRLGCINPGKIKPSKEEEAHALRVKLAALEAEIKEDSKRPAAKSAAATSSKRSSSAAKGSGVTAAAE